MYNYLVTTLLKVSLLVITFSVFTALFLSDQKVSAQISKHQYIADVNDDDLGDAITFDSKSGDWWVATSNGTDAFVNPSRWISGFGVGSTKQFVANVGGGTGADLITFDAKTGDWWVAISNDSDRFQAPSRWVKGHGVGSKNQLVGDVNGDGKEDAIAFFDSGAQYNQFPYYAHGGWWVATSNLTNNGFDTPGVWFTGGHGVGSTHQYVSDVTGDGKADAVVWSNKTGDWWVVNSSGVIFTGGPNRWANGYGIGSDSQLLQDVNGDGRADATIFFQSRRYPSGVIDSFGQWWVAPAGGPGSNTFAIPQVWSGGHGWGSTNRMIGDTDGDSLADSVAFFSNGNWYTARSSGQNFTGNPSYDSNYGPPQWITGFGVGTQ